MRKIFTFLFAALMSVGMFATTVVTITQNDFPQRGSSSFTKDGVTVSAGGIDGNGGNILGPGSFSTTLGNFTQIEVSANYVGSLGESWSGDSEKKTWTGNASSVSFSGEIMGMGMGVTLKFTIEEPAPTTYTLKLVADPAMGSVAVTNLLGSDIVDNMDGTYTVPANAEVTILATPNEGYEFTGWKEGNVLCDFIDCGTAVNTEDNPYTFTMTADVAYLAEFEAEQPQVERELTKVGFHFPELNQPADNNIEMVGSFEEGAMDMEKIIATGWFLSYGFVHAAADETFKFRDKTNNDLVLCKKVGDNWVQAIFTFGDLWAEDTWKGDACMLIEEEISTSEDYAWMEGMPEPLPTGIENIVLTEKAQKVIVDGMIYIVRDGKLYNLTGAQVK